MSRSRTLGATLALAAVLFGATAAPSTAAKSTKKTTKPAARATTTLKPLSAATATTVAPTAAPPTTSRKRDKLTLALPEAELPAIPNNIGTLAKTLGYYDAEGLDVDIVRVKGTPQVIAALQSGDADVGNLATADVVSLVSQFLLQLRAVNSTQTDLSFIIASNTSINSLKDLEGKTYAIATFGSLDHKLAEIVLENAGVNVSKVDFVAVGDPGARAQALAAGVINATTMSISTFQGIRTQPKVKILVDTGAFLKGAPIVSKVNAASPSALAKKPEAIQKLVTAQMKLARYFADNPKEWAAITAKERTDLKIENLQGLLGFFSASWCVNGCLNLANLAKTNDYLYRTPDFMNLRRIEVNYWTDPRFVKSALATLKPYEGIDTP